MYVPGMYYKCRFSLTTKYFELMKYMVFFLIFAGYGRGLGQMPSNHPLKDRLDKCLSLICSKSFDVRWYRDFKLKKIHSGFNTTCQNVNLSTQFKNIPCCPRSLVANCRILSWRFLFGKADFIPPKLHGLSLKGIFLEANETSEKWTGFETVRKCRVMLLRSQDLNV